MQKARYEQVRIMIPGIRTNTAVKLRWYWLLPCNACKWKGIWYELEKNRDGFKIDTSKPLAYDPIERDRQELEPIKTEGQRLLNDAFNKFFHYDKE